MRSNWERIKREQEGREGIFHDVAEALPGLLYARKIQQRAKAVGFEYPDLAGAMADLKDELRELEEEPSGDELGDVLFAAVERRAQARGRSRARAAARAAQRFRRRVEVAEELAAASRARIGASCRSSGRTRTSTRRRSASERDHQGSRPAGSGLARQSDRRGRGRRRRARAGRSSRPAPRPACTRRSSCATAARRGTARASPHAVANVNGEIAAAVAGLDATDQAGSRPRLIELDGTPNKGRLGANAILGVSLAVAKAAAADAGVSLFRHLGGEDATTLPVPMLNVINGGVHADNSIDLQEFMVVPAGADSFSEALRIAAETYHELKKLLRRARALDRRSATRAASRPISSRARSAIEAILEAAERAGHRDRVAIALDPASSEFFSDGRYRFEGRELEPEEMADFYADLAERFPIVSIEDGNAEDDWDGWRATTERLGDRLQLVGDDIFVTNAGAAPAGHRARRRQLDPRSR